jgi:hypothetical protein
MLNPGFVIKFEPLGRIEGGMVKKASFKGVSQVRRLWEAIVTGYIK